MFEHGGAHFFAVPECLSRNFAIAMLALVFLPRGKQSFGDLRSSSFLKDGS